jgi:hypothetical protein
MVTKASAYPPPYVGTRFRQVLRQPQHASMFAII